MHGYINQQNIDQEIFLINPEGNNLVLILEDFDAREIEDFLKNNKINLFVDY